MTRNAAPPDYYAILEVSEKASAAQIRDAYKRAALKTHPDRVANDSPEREQRTRRFQLVNDAYYTLSDPTRRQEYDSQRGYYHRSPASDPFTEADDTTGQGYSWAWDFFENQNGGTAPGGRQATEDAQFSDAFEEMMQDEGFSEGRTPNNQQGGNPSTMWGMVGAVSGGALGFIVGNVPGLLAGAVAGNRLGAIRDTKGKSVYEVFQELPQDDRARLLSQLAAKVFSHVASPP
ncbi:DnaJ domain-containing protein [Trichoderma evansii]